jgi:hypothetical protein
MEATSAAAGAVQDKDKACQAFCPDLLCGGSWRVRDLQHQVGAGRKYWQVLNKEGVLVHTLPQHDSPHHFIGLILYGTYVVEYEAKGEWINVNVGSKKNAHWVHCGVHKVEVGGHFYWQPSLIAVAGWSTCRFRHQQAQARWRAEQAWCRILPNLQEWLAARASSGLV